MRGCRGVRSTIYPNPYVRLMANYENVLDVVGGAHDGNNPDLFQLRAQVVY
jgi:hypothetical protein